MGLDELKNALLSVGVPVFRYTAVQQEAPYIVWAEDGSGDVVRAGDKTVLFALAGTIDYFTRTENDPRVKAIQNALNDTYISWRLNSVQYEQETKLIHYEWVFEVPEWPG